MRHHWHGEQGGREEVWLLRQLLEESRQQTDLLRCINDKIPSRKTSQIQIVFGGNMSATPGTVAVGSTVTGTIVPLEADGVTVTPGAVVSGQSYSVDNTALATVVTNADGTATITGVAAGTANVTALATVTDADGTVGSFTTTNSLTVTAVTPPTGRTASIQLNFA